ATFDALTFTRTATFDGARFESSVSFEGTEFDEDARFERVEVEGFFVLSGPPPAELRRPSGGVQGRTTLRDGVFHGAVDLKARTYRGGIDGSGADYAGRLSLFNATVGDGTDGHGLVLDGATFGDLDATGVTLTSPASLRLARASSLNLNQATALAGVSLLGTQV